MLLERYQARVDELLKEVRETQRDNMIAAGNMIADTVANGGGVFLSGICHSIESDVIYRGGGPIFYKRFTWKLDVESKGRERPRDGMDDNMEGLAAYALKRSRVRPGDVLVVGSVSGRTLAVVDLAYEAKKLGIKVIAFISMKYATQVDAVHSSGKKLYEIVDLVIDNCAPAAEAMMQIEGIEAPYAAASGIASDYLLWGITSVAVEALMDKGITPGILKSANFPGGSEYNKTVVEPNYEKYGW